MPLNESNPDVLVDFLDVWEPSFPDGQRRFTYILDPRLGLCRERAEPLMWGGRSRWSIENRTFNTLKNQGYHFEHNYGHGHQHLSVVREMLMMLAFLVDQMQQLWLPVVRHGLGEVRQQTCTVGEVASDLPSVPGEFDASDLRSHAISRQAVAERCVGIVAGSFLAATVQSALFLPHSRLLVPVRAGTPRS